MSACKECGGSCKAPDGSPCQWCIVFDGPRTRECSAIGCLHPQCIAFVKAQRKARVDALVHRHIVLDDSSAIDELVAMAKGDR